ncbi:MAG: hypothetical protein JXL97_11705 [Bacteroidales bacterium]|nr:hypothetical protein [Bacteroidales bacterium]
MKIKIFPILFIFIFIAPFYGTFLYFHFEKKELKKEIKKELITGINKKELVKFSVSSEEIQTKFDWKTKNEFSYQNQLYDIVSTDTKKDSVIFWCWKDNKETNLYAQLNNILSKIIGENAQDKDNQQKIINFYNSFYFTSCFIWKAEIHQKEYKNVEYSKNFSSLKIAPLYPPPKFS